MKIQKSFAALTASVLLSACGGGGGDGAASGSGSTGSSPSGDQSWLTFTPNPVAVDARQGESTAFTIKAHASKTLAQVINIGIFEDTGLITTDVQVTGGATPYDYNATLRVSPLLVPGSRSGTLVVKLCEDDPLVCNKPVSGSPWRLPLKVNVAAASTGPASPTNPTTPTSPADPVVPATPTAPIEPVTPPPPAPVTLQFDQAAYSLSFVQGEPINVTFNAVASRVLVGEAQVGVFEKSGLVSSGGGNLQSKGDKRYSIDLPLNGALAAGQYSSTLEVRVCQDNPSICAQPVSGSPWKIPLKLTVSPTVNLTALAALPGVPSWSTHQGNAGHTGAIAASVDPAKFTRRFNLPTTGQYARTIATDGNTIFAVLGSRFGSWTLQAISEDTGKEAWHVDLGTLSNVNPPAAANGKVYVTSTGHADSFLWIFDQKNGTLLAKQAMSSQWENYMAPTIYNGSVYSDAGYYGGMAKYDGTSAAEKWAVGLPQYDGWTPAVDGQYAYTYVGGNFYALDGATGATAFSVNDPRFSWHGWTADSSVVLGKNMLYAYEGGRLTALNLGTRAIAWYLEGNGAVAQPALSASALYLLHANGTVLEARDPASGVAQWVASLDGTYRQIIVTSNLAFVSNESKTLAIDLSTHKTVWTYPLGGTLAISSRGVLYIVSQQKIAAVNLQ
ncbi:outer membrane protein assembly factor BamB [Pseudoduganella lurida]|uniref:Outer membrane protein assembly factor BamB n=1 Tax=Pseudoduganella lurida TaxID=1036180 RepID=A0A562R896_9BURK|nr:PQQ-binding-like beta-propeller repeat protein [Pseudoduganella lurida]TWI65281.1 outer membrane protein assembly factor BamB [Pseudoduganella lurida]